MNPLRYPRTVAENRAGRVPRPSWVTYLVCNRCNARCGMCDSWKLPRGYELTVSEVDRIFGQVGDVDVVRLSGGEPFLRTDMLELAEAVMARSTPGVLHITTNGSFPDRIRRFVEQFSRPRRLRFMVSLDGLPEVHDASRGRVVTFDRAMRTIEALVDLRGRLGVEVSVNHTVISAESMADHEGIRARMRPLGVDVHSVLAYEDSAMYGAERRGTRADDLIVLDGYPLHSALEGADAIGFVEAELARLPEIADRAVRHGKRYYLHGLLDRLLGAEAPKPKPKCTALRSHLRILPDGKVPVCQFNTEVVGDLRVEHFENIWHGLAARDRRDWVDACDGCWAECEVMPSAIYTGDILPPLRRKRGSKPVVNPHPPRSPRPSPAS